MFTTAGLFQRKHDERLALARWAARRRALADHGIKPPREYPTDDEVCAAITSIPPHRGAALYFVYNSPLATTAAPVKQPTGTAVRTMLQLKLGSTFAARVVAWGHSFDGTAAATPGQIELFETTAAATMSTAYVNADVQPYSAGAPANASNQPIDVTGTATSGFATAAVTEGTVANYRGFDLQQTAPTNQYVREYSLGREPEWVAGRFLRVRNTFGASVNAYTWVLFEA